MNVYPLPLELRRRWCLAPGATDAQIASLNKIKPSGPFRRSTLANALAAANVETLADLALCLPEEILSLPGVKMAAFLNLQDEIIERLDAKPLIHDLTADEEAVLDRIGLRGARLPAVFGGSRSLTITTLSGFVKAGPATLLAQGLTLAQVRASRRSIKARLGRPSDADAAKVYAKRPLPPGLKEMPIKGSRLMLCWIGDLLVKEGSKTVGQAMKSLPKSQSDRDFWHEHEYRPHEIHIALAAKRLIATIPGGNSLYRVPYQDGIPMIRPPLFGDLTDNERAYLDRIDCDPRCGLSAERELAYENGPLYPDAYPAPDWINAASTYALDPMGFIAEADLPVLFEAANGRKETVCDLLIAVRRALLDREKPGSGETVFGPEHPYIRFFRNFAKAA